MLGVRARVEVGRRALRATERAVRDIRIRANAMKTTPSCTVPFLGEAAVPQLGLGLAALGRPGYINLGHGNDLTNKSVEEMRESCWNVLDHAWSQGIRYFDAARSYGRAEEFLSGWLHARGIQPDEVVVGSKWGYIYTAGWKVDTHGAPHEVKEHTHANLIKQASETEGYLGGHINVYQIHSATLESGVLDAGDVLGGLEELKRGRGWRIGLSLSGVAQATTLRKAMGVRMSDGQPLFDCVQATWNLLEQSAGPALAEAREAGMDIIIKEALANGRLTDRNTSPAFAKKLDLLKQAADSLNTQVDAVALACVMVQPWRPVVLSGAASCSQLSSNLDAMRIADILPPELLAVLCAEVVQEPGEYWGDRAGLQWN